MMAQFAAPIRQRWEVYRRRPFARLVGLFIARIFFGGGDDDSEACDLSIGLVLTLLALPGGFVSLLLLDKYSTLLQWMRGTTIDPLAAAVPDEYFFIVLSMVVSGAVAVWRWDNIFPDGRDYLNLVSLPISMRAIFLANLVAVLFLVVLLTFDVNAVSAILFPMAVGASQSRFGFFAQFAAVHALGVLLASIFTLFAVFSVLGLLMAASSPSIFRKISPYVRALIIGGLVILLSTSFAVPAIVKNLPESPHFWVRFLPSTWFLGLGQMLRGRADPELVALGRLALPGVGSAFVIAICLYAIGYRRYFVRIAEMAPVVSIRPSKQTWLGALYGRWVMRTPFQRGGAFFMWRTLFRSEPHRLVLAGVAGLGLVLASQALSSAVETGAVSRTLSADALSVPLILAFCVIVGLRVVFEIPAEMRPNWVFRFLLDADRQECEPMARKIILTCVLPWALLIVTPAYVYFGGWTVGLLHGLLVTTWSLLLTNSVLLRLRKLPFTCSLPLFRQHSIVTALACVMGFFGFAVATPRLESWALSDPILMTGAIPVVASVWYILNRVGGNTMPIERTLIFEEAPTRAVEVLHLGD
jgi:hypothetical protein